MGIFSFTGSALSNLNGNTPGANVSNLVTLLNDLKTFLNAPNLDFTNLAATVQSDYQDICQSGFVTTALTGPNNYAFAAPSIGTSVSVFPAAAHYAFRLDPADYALTGRTAKYRLKVSMLCNAVAPGMTFTFGLATPTITYGTAGNANTITAIAGVGTAATITTPGASAETDAVSTDFAAPAAGLLMPYVTVSGNMAANSWVNGLWRLQRRTV